MMPGPGVRPPGSVPSGGAWLRIALGIVVLTLAVIVWIPPSTPALGWLQVLIMVALGLVTVCAPGAIGVMLLIAAVAAARFVTGENRIDAELFGLAVLVPLVHQLAALAAVVPGRSRLQLRALLPSAVRFLIAAVLTLAALLIAQAVG